MSPWILERFSYSPTETEGVLDAWGEKFATIERPWIRHERPGGTPFQSCIPDGEYRIELYQSPTKGLVFMLRNESIGVYGTKEERQLRKGRDYIQIHTANWASEVVGCIGVGMRRTFMFNPRTDRTEPAVTASAAAMQKLIDIYKKRGSAETQLLIRPRGAAE